MLHIHRLLFIFQKRLYKKKRANSKLVESLDTRITSIYTIYLLDFELFNNIILKNINVTLCRVYKKKKSN